MFGFSWNTKKPGELVEVVIDLTTDKDEHVSTLQRARIDFQKRGVHKILAVRKSSLLKQRHGSFK